MVQIYGNRPADICIVMLTVGWVVHFFLSFGSWYLWGTSEAVANLLSWVYRLCVILLAATILALVSSALSPRILAT